MTFCKNCGQQLLEDSKFCHKCGTPTVQNDVESETNRKMVYDGEIHKCPNCGELLKSFETNCPICGYELRDVLNSNAVRNFAEKLTSVVEHHEKISIIRNFPIPNTKEDIWEFMILASTNVDSNLENDLLAAWQSKVEQAYYKAQMIIKDEKEFENIKNMYYQVCIKLNKDRKIQAVKKAGSIVSELVPILPNLIFVIGWLISIFILLPICKKNLDDVGFNAYQSIIILDFIAGTFFIPLSFKCVSPLPKLITSLGLILSIVLLIPLCGKNLDSVGFNAFQMILIVDIICSVIIFVKMFKHKTNVENEKGKLNSASLIIALICVVLFLIVYSITDLTIPKSKTDLKNKSMSITTETSDTEGIYTYEVRNYIGKNLAAIGKEYDGNQIDEYGKGKLKLNFVTENGIIVTPSDDELKKQYTVVDQSIKAGSNLTITHLRDSKGEPYSNLVDYQSYDEILLFVAPIGNTSYKPSYTTLLPTLDRHIYHIRDYVGRNAASFGVYYGDDYIDEYGAGKLRISFKSEDGSYIDSNDKNILKCYIVTGQDINVNTELKLEYETDSKGKEYDNLIQSQNYEEITITVKKLDDSLIAKMPELKIKNNLHSTNEYEELTIEYTVIKNGKAKITGFSGNGNHATINRKIDGHEVICIGESAFKNCDTLESILLWADIESIDDYAFYGCTSLTEISIPNETTVIGTHAFENCTNLSDLIIWGNPSIGDYAFSGCTSITDISISMNTPRIGAHAFDGCSNLESLIIWDDNTIVEKDAFSNCPKLKDRPMQK